MALGNHLRADQHVDLAVAETREQRGQRASAPDRVAVEPADARTGTRRLHFGFDALGAEAGLLEIGPGAQRAGLRHAGGVVAVVAARAAR